MNSIEAQGILDRIAKEAPWLQNARVRLFGIYCILAHDPHQQRDIQFTDTKDFDDYVAALERHRNKEGKGIDGN